MELIIATILQDYNEDSPSSNWYPSLDSYWELEDILEAQSPFQFTSYDGSLNSDTKVDFEVRTVEISVGAFTVS